MRPSFLSASRMLCFLVALFFFSFYAFFFLFPVCILYRTLKSSNFSALMFVFFLFASSAIVVVCTIIIFYYPLDSNSTYVLAT